MNESETISIAVPVHNAEAFLAPTLDALTAQTYRNLEIILVDDASTDASARICAEYAARDSRIRLIRKSVNQGQGAARNDALRIASGSCIGFCDSDDLPDRDMFEKLYSLLTDSGADIAVCSFRTWRGKRRSGNFSSPQILSPEEAVLQILADDTFGAFSWNKLFRADLLKRTGEFPSFGYEDLAFIPRVCAEAGRIVRTGEDLYYYRQHPGSVTCSPFNPWKMNLLKAYNLLLPDLLSRFPDRSARFYGKAWFDMMGLFNSILRSGKEYPEEMRIVLKRAAEYRAKTSLRETPSFWKGVAFALALRLPGLYRRLFRLLH